MKWFLHTVVVLIASQMCNGQPHGISIYGCDSPPRVDNGFIENDRNVPGRPPVYDAPPLSAPPAAAVSIRWKPDDVIRYRCINGYELVGEERRVCEDSGRWSGEAPRCVSKNQLSRQFCNAPPPIENGYIQNDDNTAGSDTGFALQSEVLHSPVQVSVQWVEGDVIKYGCDPNYELLGGSKRRFCSAGKWTGEAPRCIRKELPPSVCFKPYLPSNARIASQVKYSWNRGESISIRCNTGYIARPDKLTCGMNGMWEGGQVSCLPTPKSPCQDWKRLSNGIYYTLTRETGTFEQAILNCKMKGGALVGSSIKDYRVTRALTELYPGVTYWIGLSDARSENDWTWVDGSGRMAFSELRNRFPQEDLYWGERKDCAYLGDQGGFWRADDCMNRHHALCQRNWCESLNWKQSAFPSGFEAVQLMGPFTHAEAKKRCQDLGGWIIKTMELVGNDYVNPGSLQIRGRGFFSQVSGWLCYIYTHSGCVDDTKTTTPQPTTVADETTAAALNIWTLDDDPEWVEVDDIRVVGDAVGFPGVQQVGSIIVHSVFCERHTKPPPAVVGRSVLQGNGLDSQGMSNSSLGNSTAFDVIDDQQEDIRANDDDTRVIKIPTNHQAGAGLDETTNVCEPNPCLHGCVCEILGGSRYLCSAPIGDQYIGTNCEYEPPRVSCGKTVMDITVSAEILNDMDAGVGSGVFFLAPDHSTARNVSNVEKHCRFSASEQASNSLVAFVPEPFSSCGTKMAESDEGKITFSNKIWFGRLTSVVNDLIVDTSTPIAEVSCVYETHYHLTSTIDAICCETPPLITSSGIFNFRSSLWRDPPGVKGSNLLPNGKERQPIRGINGVVSYKAGNMLYVTVEMTSSFEGQSSLVPAFRQCWLSANISSTSPMKDDVLLHPRSESVTVGTWGPTNTPGSVHFGFQLFRYEENRRVYLHCLIDVVANREKRSLMESQGHQVTVLTKGPIYFTGPRMEGVGKSEDAEVSSDQLVIAVGIFGLVCVVLLLSCCLVHLRIVYRRHGYGDINSNQKLASNASSASRETAVTTVSSVCQQ